MTELDKIWKNCLQMWKWIAKVYDDRMEEVDILKHEWLKKHGFSSRIPADCFFCEYVQDRDIGCEACPARLVAEYFSCEDDGYNYKKDPKAFYAEILRLDTIRTKGK